MTLAIYIEANYLLCGLSQKICYLEIPTKNDGHLISLKDSIEEAEFLSFFDFFLLFVIKYIFKSEQDKSFLLLVLTNFM